MTLWFALILAAATPVTPWKALTDDERAALLAKWKGEPLPNRLLNTSERFLNEPYVFSPLGEGEGKDPDPMIRFDAFDCLSLVEETLAISLAPSPEEIEPLLTKIRYGASVSYDDRNHLMEAEWLPHAIGIGILRNVTREYGGDSTEQVKTVLTDASWRSPSSRSLMLPPDHQVKGELSFPVIPLEKVLAHVRRVPSGTVLVVVREARPFKVTRMTHLGFVVQRGGHTFLRHASKSRHHRVVDEDLAEFLARNAKYDKWPVTGVALYEALEPDLSQLTPPTSPGAPPPQPPAPPPAEKPAPAPPPRE